METPPAPKPGPRLTLPSVPAPDGNTAVHASHHARQASFWLEAAESAAKITPDSDDLIDFAAVAQAHAMASIAWTNLNPPGRRVRHHSPEAVH